MRQFHNRLNRLEQAAYRRQQHWPTLDEIIGEAEAMPQEGRRIRSDGDGWITDLIARLETELQRPIAAPLSLDWMTQCEI